MDEKVKFNDQIQEKAIDGQVILINKFNVTPDKIDQFVKAWGEDAANFKKTPGFISAQLHKGIGGSNVFINYAIWESLEHYKEAFNKVTSDPESQSIILQYDDGLVISPHLFTKVSVPGICTG